MTIQIRKDRRFIDLSGAKFSKLLVKSFFGKRRWLCVCDCGNEAIVLSYHLKSGHTTSCGCNITKMLLDRNTTHNKRRTPEYGVWSDMKKRCENPNHRFYSYYGGRGIKVCEYWQSFDNFYKDMAPRPDGLTIDRIDSNGDYSPDNCRWATRTEQTRNRKNSKFIEWRGQKIPLIEAAKMLGIKYSCIADRLRMGWTNEKIMTNGRIN